MLGLLGLVVLGWQYGRPYLPGGAPARPPAAPPPPQVTVAKPVVKEVVQWHEFTGRFAASDQVDLRSRIAGYIESIHFKDGALVKKGDLLFSIDQRPARYALEQAKASMQNAQSRIEFSERDTARAEQLTRSGSIATNVADQRKRDMMIAQADMHAAQAAAGRAQLDMEYAQIRAPFDGRVSRKAVSVGNLVKIDDTLLTTLVAVAPIHFYFDIDERSLLQALRAQQLRPLVADPRSPTNPVAAAAIPDRAAVAISREALIALTDETEARHKGDLDFVDNRVDDATGTLRMRAVVANADGDLRPGLFGRVRIQTEQPQRGVLVPDEAIGSDQDRRIVYVLGSDGTAKATTVLLGPRIDGYRLVRSGLSGDETIIVNGLLRVRPGAKVTPKETTLPLIAGQAGGSQPSPSQPSPSQPSPPQGGPSPPKG